MEEVQAPEDTGLVDNAYKVTISGTYRTREDDVDFEAISGYIPANTDTIVIAAAIKRYALMWLKERNKGKVNITGLREVYVEGMEPCRHEFSYAGKDIRHMSLEELQDLAVAFDLREVPLYKKSSLLETRKQAYAHYCDYVLESPVDVNAENFSMTDAKPIVVPADTYQDNTLVRTVLQDNDARTKGKESEAAGMPREKLFEMARRMGIKVPQSASYQQVYKMVFA